MEPTALPFVISTEAQRSGEICGFSDPFLEMFFLRPVLKGQHTYPPELPRWVCCPFNTRSQDAEEICRQVHETCKRLVDRL